MNASMRCVMSNKSYEQAVKIILKMFNEVCKNGRVDSAFLFHIYVYIYAFRSAAKLK